MIRTRARPSAPPPPRVRVFAPIALSLALLIGGSQLRASTESETVQHAAAAAVEKSKHHTKRSKRWLKLKSKSGRNDGGGRKGERAGGGKKGEGKGKLRCPPGQRLDKRSKGCL